MPLLKWSNYIQKNLFSDNDVFFELPYLSKSPDLMVQAVICMPISEHKIKLQLLEILLKVQ